MIIILLYDYKTVNGIYCYECTGGRQDQTCSRYAGTSCEYGLFGCVKIATFSGGVNKSFFLYLKFITNNLKIYN